MYREIFKFTERRPSFAGFGELTWQFNSAIVKTLKPAFTYLAVVFLYNEEKSFGDKIVYQYGLFEPAYDRCYISLDNTFKPIEDGEGIWKISF